MGTYSFLDVEATIIGPGGAVSIGSSSGASDEGITVEPSVRNTMTTGAGVGVMHSLQAQKSGKLSVHLLKTSPVNAQLSVMQALQMATPSLHGQNVITVTEQGLGDVVTATEVAFTRPPALSYSKDGAMNTWEFDVGQLDELLGSGGSV